MYICDDDGEYMYQFCYYFNLKTSVYITIILILFAHTRIDILCMRAEARFLNLNRACKAMREDTKEDRKYKGEKF